MFDKSYVIPQNSVSSIHVVSAGPTGPGGLFTNVCRSAAATQIVRPLSSPRYALFTNDVVRRRSWRAYDVVRTTKIMLNIYGRDAIYSADVMHWRDVTSMKCYQHEAKRGLMSWLLRYMRRNCLHDEIFNQRDSKWKTW